MRWKDVTQEDDGPWVTFPTTKNKKPHRVPLSPQAVDVLERLRARGGSSAFVFPTDKPGRGDRPIASPGHAARRLKDATGIEDVHVHDFSRTVGTNLQKLGFSWEVIASVLNHTLRGVTRVYARHDYAKEKRDALVAWARKIDSIVTGRVEAANVVLMTSR